MSTSESQYELSESELHILRFIRNSASRVSISKISDKLAYTHDNVVSALKKLIEMNFVRQDRRDRLSDIDFKDERATYFTVLSKRKQIDDVLHNSEIASPRSKRNLNVFLCHASDDKKLVRDLYRRLLSDNVDAWLDEVKILPGQDWDQEIQKAVQNADAIIVCISHSSVTKEGYIQKEIRRALSVAEEKPENTIFLIPLLLEKCDIPTSLKRWQWVDYTEAKGYYRLLDSLRLRAQKLGVNEPQEKL